MLLLVSVGFNYFLAHKNRQFRRVIAHIKEEARLREGDMVPYFEGRDIDGRPVVVRYLRPTLVYVLKPSCPWCNRNVANINALAGFAKSKYEVVGISLSPDGLREHVSASQYQFPIVAEIPATTAVELKLGGTPQTIVISRESKVIRSWIGAYSGATAVAIQDFFGFTLPGLIRDGRSDSRQIVGQLGLLTARVPAFLPLRAHRH